MKYIKFKMAEPSWRMALVPFNNKHEVIMTSQILLKTVYMLANFLILSDIYFGLYGYFEVTCDQAFFKQKRMTPHLRLTLRGIWILPINATI